MSAIDASVALWSTDDRSGKPLVVLLHGVGSHEGDLIGLAPHLPSGFAYVSLRAPGTYGGGFSWYPLAEPGRPRSADVDEAADAVLAFVDSLGDAHPSDSLLGFSQGGSLALQLLRTAPTRFASAVALAGFVVPGGDEAADEALAAAKVPVFYGRGDADPVITADAVDRTAQWIETHVEGEQHVYAGLAHGVSPDELADVSSFLTRMHGA